MSDENDHDGGEPGEKTDIMTLPKTKVQQPRMYKVIMHNDDYTTMDFVVHVLKRFFKKNDTESHSIMLKIHNDGQAICGIFTFEIAESKVMKVNRYAREKGHPLKTSTEPAD